MGGEIEEVPERTPVAGGPPKQEKSGFGTWLRTQRELRGVAPEFVSHRTKLTPERIAAIERDEPSLGNDGPGRLAARALAEAIGADGDEAVRILVERVGDPSAPERGLTPLWLRRLVAILALTSLAGAGYLAFHWILTRAPDPPVELVHRPDYVQRALTTRSTTEVAPSSDAEHGRAAE